MLNRLFIVIGVLTIIAISAAFLVPRFINWGDYRGRMEEVASEALGAPVHMAGDVSFQLLPQPVLTFSDVQVGSPEAPVLTVAHVEAEFSLLDFLRDRYRITRLVLDRPTVELSVGLDGALATGIAPAPQVSETNLSIENATISRGTVIVADARAGVARVESVEGELKLSAVGGALGFSGRATLANRSYKVRFTTTAADGDGKAQLALFGQTADETTSLLAEGDLLLVSKPLFTGNLTVRRRPPPAREDLVQGDLVITSSIEADFDHVLLPSYTILPDENRAGTRLTGAARLALGAEPKFEAVISGGVLALPPRDVTGQEGAAPYELVRLLKELPAPPVPGVAGKLGVDIAELNLRAVALRNVRFDAESRPDGWSISNFAALLPGNGTIRLAGKVTVPGERPTFEGEVTIATQRPEALAALWRKPAPGGGLFNVSATLTAGVRLGEESLQFSRGQLRLDEQQTSFSATIGFGAVRRLDVNADFGALDARQSGILAALLPDLSPAGSFGVTFPAGSATLKSARATLFDMSGRGLAAECTWEGGVLELKRLSADDLGGVRFDLAATIFGTVARPELSGEGTLKVASADAPALARLFDALGVPEPIHIGVNRSLPADLALKLDPPGGDGSQGLAIAGRAGVAELSAKVQLGGGLARAAQSPIGLKLDLVSPDVAGLSAQLGLGQGGLFAPEGPMHLALSLEGEPAGDLDATVLLESGTDSIGFVGDVVAADPSRWSGSGVLKVALSDPEPLAEQFGAAGIGLPGVSGTAQLNFTGLDDIQLSGIDGKAGEARFSGTLGFGRPQGTPTIAGELTLTSVPVEGLAATVLGPAALIGGSGVWPEGPLGGAGEERSTSGRVHVTAPVLTAGGADVLKEVALDIDWDNQGIRVRNLWGAVGGGRLMLDAGLCCAGPSPQRTLTARVSLENADLTSLLPPAAAARLDGAVSGAAQVEGTGESLAAVMASLAGEGSYQIRDLRVAGFDAATFAEIGGLEGILDMQPDDLAARIKAALAKGPFEAGELAGSFTVAGGVVRSPNLAVRSPRARMFGGINVALADLALDGSFALTPVGSLGADGFINETTTQVVARLGGTVVDPEPDYDVAGMVDAIQIHAYEAELAELERLRAEDEARVAAAQAARREQRAAAAVTAALAAAIQPATDSIEGVGDAAQVAAEAKEASIAEAEEAARKAAEAARRAATQQPSSPPPQAPLQPLVLTPTEPASRF